MIIEVDCNLDAASARRWLSGVVFAGLDQQANEQWNIDRLAVPAVAIASTHLLPLSGMYVVGVSYADYSLE